MEGPSPEALEEERSAVDSGERMNGWIEAARRALAAGYRDAALREALARIGLPPCRGCVHWFPTATPIWDGEILGLRLCHNPNDIEHDFSCFRSRDDYPETQAMDGTDGAALTQEEAIRSAQAQGYRARIEEIRRREADEATSRRMPQPDPTCSRLETPYLIPRSEWPRELRLSVLCTDRAPHKAHFRHCEVTSHDLTAAKIMLWDRLLAMVGTRVALFPEESTPRVTQKRDRTFLASCGFWGVG
jgi:hypothetical protein